MIRPLLYSGYNINCNLSEKEKRDGLFELFYIP